MKNKLKLWSALKCGSYRQNGKRFLLLLAGLCLIPFAIAQENPENAEYYIDGYLQNDIQNGDFVYKLTRVTSQKITFDKELSGYHLGVQQPNEEIGYTFSHCIFEGQVDAPILKFWKQDTVSGIWQQDREVTQGSLQYTDSRNMLILLVLDCTSSLGNDFQTMKNSAKDFINTIISRCPNGNVDIGIIGFNTIGNTDRTVFQITPLTKDNQTLMDRFIDGQLQMARNTALYYAMDKGCDLLEEYVSELQKSEPVKYGKYDNASIVVFTDGLDNHSTNAAKGLKNYDMYHSYIVNRMNKMQLFGQSLTRHVICVQGNDLTDTAKFYSALKSVASTADGEQNFYLVREFAGLQKQFADIASDLISRWRNLVCYVPGGIETRVRWTLGEIKPVAPPKPPKERKQAGAYLPIPLLSFNVGTGGGYSKPTRFLDLAVGVDLAVAVKEKIAIGAYASYKSTFSTLRQCTFGLSLVAGPQEKSFLFGLGVNKRFLRSTNFDDKYDGTYYEVQRTCKSACDFDLRVGGVFKAVYFFVDFTIGKYHVSDVYCSSSGVLQVGDYLLPQVHLNLGINFIRIGKKK